MQRTLTYTGFSLPGHRKDNQDRYEIFRSKNRTELLAIVADGMGGHKDGAMAAEAVIHTARELWAARVPGVDMREFLLHLVNCAHAAVIEAGKIHGTAPRTTLAAFYVRDDSAISVHLGDSRIIQFSAGGFVKRTMDHSVAQLKLLQGTITEAEIATDPDQNKLFNCVGGDVPPEPDLEVWTLVPSSRFVLCTDGYWSLFTEDELTGELNRVVGLSSSDLAAELTRSTNKLIQLRKQHDNTTAIFIYMDTQAKDKGAVKLSGKQKAIMVLVALILAAAVFMLLRNSTEASGQSAPVRGETGDLLDSPPDEGVSRDTNDNRSEGGDESSGESSEGFGEEASSDSLDETDNQSETETRTGESGAGDKHTQTPAIEQQSERGVELPESIPTQRQKVSIPVTASTDIVDGNEVADKTGKHLKETGVIGSEDSLSPTDPEKNVGNAQVLKLQQLHRGLPVYGAEVVVIVEGDAITDIESKSVADITLNIEPGLSYAEALAKAAARSGEVLEAQDEGRLIIYKVRQGYRLSWQGLVAGNTLETLIIDAENADILHRYSALYKDNQHNDE